jgi:hypothetical protein
MTDILLFVDPMVKFSMQPSHFSLNISDSTKMHTIRASEMDLPTRTPHHGMNAIAENHEKYFDPFFFNDQEEAGRTRGKGGKMILLPSLDLTRPDAHLLRTVMSNTE